MAEPTSTPAPSLTLDEAMALLDRHAAEAAADAAETVKKKKKDKEKAKDAIQAGAKQGRAGLGIHTKNLLDQID